MSILREFPLEFWDRDDLISIDVLGEILNEVRQPTQSIVGFCELLLKTDLTVQQKTDITTILEQAKYLESILEAGRVYYIKVVDK